MLRHERSTTTGFLLRFFVAGLIISELRHKCVLTPEISGIGENAELIPRAAGERFQHHAMRASAGGVEVKTLGTIVCNEIDVAHLLHAPPYIKTAGI